MTARQLDRLDDIARRWKRAGLAELLNADGDVRFLLRVIRRLRRKA